MSGRMNSDMDPPLRKRLAELQIRRETLIEAMSKYQDAKKSALYQYLNENRDEEAVSSPCNAGFKDDCPASAVRNSAAHKESNGDRDCSTSISRRPISNRDPPLKTEIYKARGPKVGFRPRLPPTSIDGNMRRVPYSEQQSLISSEKRETYRSKSFTSSKNSLEQFDAPSSTQAIDNSLSRTKKNSLEDSVQHSLNGVPSDEVTTCDGTGDDSAASPISDESRNTRMIMSFLDKHEALIGTNDSRDDHFNRVENEGDTLVELKNSDSSRNARKIMNFLDQHEALIGTKDSRDDHFIRAENEGDTLMELRNSNIIYLESVNQEGEHSILTREPKENNKHNSEPTIISDDNEIHTQSSRMFHPDSFDRQVGLEDVETRFTSNNIFEDPKTTGNKRSGKYEIEDKFLNLFVHDEETTPTKDNAERKFIKSERTPNGDKISLERKRTRNGFRVGCKPRTTKENGHDNATDAEADADADDNDNDHMALLEKKLNMMISKKPLWQKALQDLYDDPVDSKLSVSTTSSGITKPPSEAETICSIDTPSLTYSSKSDFLYQKKESNGLADSSADIKVGSLRNLTRNNTNDVDSVAETDTIDSWRNQSVCSMDSLSITASSRIAIPQQEYEKNKIDSKADSKVENDIAEVGSNRNDGISANEIPMIESHYIQKLRNIDLDTLPEILSEENSTIGKTSKDGWVMEKDGFQNAQIEAEIESLRTAESNDIVPPKKEEEMVSTHIGQRCTQIMSSQSNHSSMIGEKSQAESEIKKDLVKNAHREFGTGFLQIAKSNDIIVPLDEERIVSQDDEQKQVQSMNLKSNLQTEAKIESPQAVKSKASAPLDEEQIALEHDEQQKIAHLKSNQQQQVEIESLQTITSKDSSSLDVEHMVLKHVEQQHIQSLHLQSNQQTEVIEIDDFTVPCEEEQMVLKHVDLQHIQSMHFEEIEGEIESLPTAEIDDISEPLHEEQMVSQQSGQQEIQSMYLQYLQSIQEIEIDSPQTSESGIMIASVLEEEIGSPHTGQQHVQSLYSKLNHCEMLSRTANLKTPPISNARKEFFSEIDKVGNINLMQQQNVMNQQYFVDGDNPYGTERSQVQKVTTQLETKKLCDVNLVEDQRVENLSNYFDWEVTSELSENSSSNSLEASSSTACSEEKTDDDDFGTSNDGIGDDDDDDNDNDDDDSEKSSMKPPVPDTVTMLTDFTIQSITYASNNSTMDSLGEESIVEEIQPNRKPSNYFFGSSNSESTIIGEKIDRKRKENALKVTRTENSDGLRKENALQVTRTEKSYADGLLTILKNPSVLCQCTGPVALNDVAWSYSESCFWQNS